MKPLRAARRIAGFTLVEALLATLLMGILLGVLATVTARWLPNWDRGLVRMQHADLLGTGLDRLIADLAAAEFVYADAATDTPIFDGSEATVTFVRTTIGPNSFSGLEIVRLTEASDSHGPALVRQTARFVPGQGDPRKGTKPTFSGPVVLLRTPHRVAFAYAGPDRVWRNSWQGRDELPRAVRVTVRDDAALRTVAVATSTLISAEVPARCIRARTIEQCRRGSQPASTAAGGAETARLQGQ
jgi:general secretion pathway protein J